MLAGHLTGPKARIALALGIGAGLDRPALATLLGDPAPIHDEAWFWSGMTTTAMARAAPGRLGSAKRPDTGSRPA